MPRAILDDTPAATSPNAPSPPPAQSSPAPEAAEDAAKRIVGPFTGKEDDIIQEFVNSSHEKPFTDWSSLAEKLPGRERKKIRDRWVNHLNPALNLLPFGRDDDLRLKEAYDSLGPKWKEISDKHFDGNRSENQIKNRYNSASYKKISLDGFPEGAYAYNENMSANQRDTENDDENSPEEPSDENGSKSTSLSPVVGADGEKINEGGTKEVDGEKTDKKDAKGDGEDRDESETLPSPVKEVDSEKTDEGEESLVSSGMKRKKEQIQDGSKKNKPLNSTALATLLNNPQQQLLQQQQFGMHFNPQLINPQQMMNVQMMNGQMMHWGQQIVPLLAAQAAQAANVAAAQRMAMLMGSGNSNPLQAIPSGFSCEQVILTLPPPNIKLGMVLEDHPTYGLPELKSLAINSPIRSQLPEAFQKDCCITSLKSEVIGHVQPKSAQQCAMLISKSQQGKTKPMKLEMVLVKMKTKMDSLPRPPAGKNPSAKKGDSNPPKRGRKTEEERHEYNQKKKLALLDFFSDENKPTYANFCRENKYDESLRSAMGRVINSDKRLSWLMDKREKSEHRKEAYTIIERLLPDTTAEKVKFNKTKKAALLNFFRDDRCPTLETYCHDKKLDVKTRNAMKRFIESDTKMSKLVDRRKIPERREEALKIIENLLRDDLTNEASEKAAFEKKQKTHLFDFFSDSNGTSLALFCEENEFDSKMRGAIVRFIDKNKRLVNLVDMRSVPERREEAINIIEEGLPMINTKYSKPADKEQAKCDTSEKEKDSPSDATANAFPKSHRQVCSTFFSPENVKQVASNLDFEARPRMTRDGSKEIVVHDRRAPDEVLMLLIFDFNNRVVKGRATSIKDKNSVLASCSKILFYDHGYKKVVGLSNLEKNWEKRLEQAYLTGAEQQPLNRQYVGKVSYTDEIEKKYPGLLAKLYKYTEESIGKEASYSEKAMFMNEKSMEDNHDDPAMPVLKLIQSNLFNWVKQQKLGGAEDSTEGDLSIDQIEKRYPGLIEELYKFALEAMGPDVSHHILATCMNERSKEDVEENPTVPLVTVSKNTLPNWIKKRGL